MATIRYQLAKGGKRQDVVTSSPAAFADDTVRVDIDFTADMSRQQAIEALEEIKQRIMAAWPPA